MSDTDDRRRARLTAIVDDLREQRWHQVCGHVPELMPLVDPIARAAANTRATPLDRLRLYVRRAVRWMRGAT